MTHHPIKILEDGTRVYSNYTRYKPKPAVERKYKVRKPDVPGAVMYNKEWFLPLPVLPEDDRDMPDTRPDTVAYDHMEKRAKCRCEVCTRPEAQPWKDKWTRDGIRSGRLPRPPRSRKRRRPRAG